MATRFSADKYARVKGKRDEPLSKISKPPAKKSLRLTTNYLAMKEKVVMVNLRAEVAEVESSKLRKDLIETMDQANEAKAKLKEVIDQLRMERMLVVQKDKEIALMKLNISEERENVVVDFLLSQAFDIITFGKFFKGFELLRWWKIKYHFDAVDYSDMDLEAIDKEMTVDRETEQARWKVATKEKALRKP
nr:hypothetical protein CFP56_29727 [Quercus suber]